jgi:hypothetical protein
MRIAHRGICASPDAIFGSHSRHSHQVSARAVVILAQPTLAARKFLDSGIIINNLKYSGIRDVGATVICGGCHQSFVIKPSA